VGVALVAQIAHQRGADQATVAGDVDFVPGFHFFVFPDRSPVMKPIWRLPLSVGAINWRMASIKPAIAWS
jgi:hypothetical protein